MVIEVEPEMTRAMVFPPVRPAGGGAAARTGELLSGRYRIESLLATGASGTVYRALDLIRQERCAIKVLPPGASLPPEAARRLFHPHIVRVLDCGADAAGAPFLVMELLSGCTLQALLAAGGALPFARAIELLRAVGAALDYMHSQGLAHLSLQPEHVFLTGEPGREAVMLIGLGQVQLLGPDGAPGRAFSTLPGQSTSAYAAPERTLARDGGPDARADQWSLAVLAYRLLTGREPFADADPCRLGWTIRHGEPPSLHELAPGLPEHVCRAVQRALAKRREHRFGRVHDFIRALEDHPSLAAPRPIAREERPGLQAGLIVLTRGDALSTAVPEPIVSEVTTARCSSQLLSEALRRSSDTGISSVRPHTGAEPTAERAVPLLAPITRDGLRVGRRPPRWLMAAFSVAVALVALLVLRQSLGGREPLAPSSATPAVSLRVPAPRIPAAID